MQKSAGPGRPKDLEKRAAILDAAKHLFVHRGFDGASMDAIAAAAGVSKLTVYSHFHDKETLFSAAVAAKCEELMPAGLFTAHLKGTLRQQLLAIARAFFVLVTSEDAVAIHRMVVASAAQQPKLAELFWEAGAQRTMTAFEGFLRDAVRRGKLGIDDVHRAASQFFCLLKGESHARMEFGCAEPLTSREIEAHLETTVDFFLRGYAPR